VVVRYFPGQGCHSNSSGRTISRKKEVQELLGALCSKECRNLAANRPTILRNIKVHHQSIGNNICNNIICKIVDHLQLIVINKSEYLNSLLEIVRNLNQYISACSTFCQIWLVFFLFLVKTLKTPLQQYRKGLGNLGKTWLLCVNIRARTPLGIGVSHGGKAGKRVKIEIKNTERFLMQMYKREK
jgi:hypothetical protein